MKLIERIAIIASAVLSVACTKEMDSPQEDRSISQITATYAESRTRTVLGEDGTSVLWSPKDEISVFYDGDGMKFTGINSTPKAKTIFLSSGMFLYGGTESASSEKEYLYGIYPYSSDNVQEGEYLTLTVPDTQPAVEGSFARGAFPSVGRSKDTDIAFYNVCGGIRFSVTAPGVQKVVFSGMNDECLAGKVKTVFDEDGKPVVSTILEGKKELVLYNLSGFTPGKFYYISAIPTALANGFKMEFYTASKHATLTPSSAVEIKRSIFGTLKDADAELIYEDGGCVDVVDLGLSVKWAPCNIGAGKPEDCGDYFAWGETTGYNDGKTVFNWSTYKWCNGSNTTLTKYNTKSDYGTVDNKTVLEADDDVAHVRWGGSWRMPTYAEWDELIANCTWTWGMVCGVYGFRVTSNKEGYTDKAIFLPAAGYRYDGNLYSVGSYGDYWSSSLLTGSPYLAWDERFYSGGARRSDYVRYCGRSVRPVSE